MWRSYRIVTQGGAHTDDELRDSLRVCQSVVLNAIAGDFDDDAQLVPLPLQRCSTDAWSPKVSHQCSYDGCDGPHVECLLPSSGKGWFVPALGTCVTGVYDPISCSDSGEANNGDANNGEAINGEARKTSWCRDGRREHFCPPRPLEPLAPASGNL